MDDEALPPCRCGGEMEEIPDHQYGTVWRCTRCGQEYADEE